MQGRDDGFSGVQRTKRRGQCRACSLKTACLAALASTAFLSCMAALTWLGFNRDRNGGSFALKDRVDPVHLRRPRGATDGLANNCESCDERSMQASRAEGAGGGLVLIKSFKTGSTTVATYIAQVGHQRGSYFLHPRSTGWFARGELESRRDGGQTFDVSLRHVTPYTPYDLLEGLVPGARFFTIMREPFQRFLSLFNFRGDIKRKYKTPQALVAAIHAGKVSQNDARPFCNQLAWLMSGQDVDYTNVVNEDEALRVAQAVVQEAETRGVTVLLTERMSESIAVLAHRMQWPLDELKLKVGSQRVQKQGGGSRLLSCGGNVEMCSTAIRGCNLVDELLYNHYETKFQDLVRALPTPVSERAASFLDSMPTAKSSMSPMELGAFPTNCIDLAADGPNNAATQQEVYRRLHSCNGRPT